MSRAAIAVDDHKLKLFKNGLTAAGYKYEQGDGVTSDTKFLYVETDDLIKLGALVQELNDQARRNKMN